SPSGCVLRRAGDVGFVAGVVVFEDTSAAEVCLPIAALILSAFLVPGTRVFLASSKDGSTATL
ncbi:MAG TPA: hypothetical protein VE977_06995, partial [Pyrinomonadaceae bacterium]|nr:hypothetical protein [Pyrinomonadaceae bacterium]